MKKNHRLLTAVLLTALVLVCFAGCQPAVEPDPTPAQPERTTEYYMTAGWSANVNTPTWTSKDANTVTVPAAKLQGDGKTIVTNYSQELLTALNTALSTPDYFKPVKNVIIIIGDGMGIDHVRASEKWSGDLIMTKLPYIGAAETSTREAQGIITDSAAGGTAIATGYKTTKLFASIDAEGNNLKSVSELARENGKLVGIVTNAELADATPADFSVHNKNRSQGWTKICQQEVVFGADLFMGNGYDDYYGYFNSGNPLYHFTQENNMKLYYSASEVVSHFSDDSKMWAIFSATANKFARFDTKSSLYPNLQQMTSYALAWLDEHDTSDQGFVVMIENTYTDHFGHGNTPSDGSPNTYGIVKEVQSCDEAVAIALKYVLEHPDTALIVTADHETGGMMLMSNWETNFARVVANSGNHSDLKVPVFAIGYGMEELNSLSEEDRAAGRWYNAAVYANAKTGQVIGKALGDPNFGGDVGEDNSSKVSPAFDVTVTEATKNLTFTLDFTGVPVSKGNLIQFKIKPVSNADSVKLELKNGAEYTTIFDKSFSTATAANAVTKDSNGNVATNLSVACKQAFVPASGAADGWYQFSVPATVASDQLRITLTAAAENYPVDTVIGMDDLTIQYGSTIGYLSFASTQATSTLDVL